MIPSLLFTRDFIIRWVNFWIAPVEHTFNIIESELERRGVELDRPPKRTL